MPLENHKPKIYQDAEQFINETYWQDTHDATSQLNIEEIVSEKLIEDDAAKDPEYYSHREGVVHVSSLSKCLRGVVHEMLKAEKDGEIEPRKLGVFKAGNLFEDFIIEALGNRVVHKQREYQYHYKNLLLVGRSDYTVDDNGVMRVGENKSVHSDSFWYRQKEGNIVAWNNLIQLQVYMWLERVLNGNTWEGIFSYVSKDDVTVVGAPVKFNQKIIDEVVIPALDIISEAYEKKDPNLAPIPEAVIYSVPRHQYQKNWLCTYCDYHSKCAGSNWMTEAAALVSKKNTEMKEKMNDMPHLKKTKSKVVPA